MRQNDRHLVQFTETVVAIPTSIPKPSIITKQVFTYTEEHHMKLNLHQLNMSQLIQPYAEREDRWIYSYRRGQVNILY